MADKGSAGFCEVLADLRGIGELADPVDEAVEVVRGKQVTGFVVQADFRGAVAVVGDDGLAGGEGLGKDPGQAFATREVDEDVHQGEMRRNGGRGHEAGKEDPASEVGLGGEGFEALTPGAVADEPVAGWICACAQS